MAGQSEALKGGDQDRSAEGDAVVSVNGGCTGTLITPNVVITAGHCLDAEVRALEPWDHWEPSVGSVGFGFNLERPRHRAKYCAINSPPRGPDGRGRGTDILMLRLNQRILPELATPKLVLTDALPGGVDAWNRFWPGQLAVAKGFGNGRDRQIALVEVHNMVDPRVDLEFRITARDNDGDGVPDVPSCSPYLDDPPGTVCFLVEQGDSGGPTFWTDDAGLFGAPNLEYLIGTHRNTGGQDQATWWPDNTFNRGAKGPWIRHTIDPDADGQLLGELGPTPPAAVDIDGDMIPDEGFDLDLADNCPMVANPDQLDSDCDGVGDVCDNCVDTPNADQGDCDGDGVGNVCQPGLDPGLDGDYCTDNCPRVTNPLQDNCNLDAELAAGVTPRGDACDPIPCGETRIRTTSTPESPLPRPGQTVRRNLVQVDPRASLHQHTYTGFRFCSCAGAEHNDLRTRNRCKLSQAGNTGACAINDLADYGRAESMTNPWAETTMDYLGPSPEDGTGRRHEVRLSYTRPIEGVFRERFDSIWDQEADRPRWDAIHDFDPRAPLAGVLWTHGTRDRVRRPLPHRVELLASHYWSGDIPDPVVTLDAIPCLRYAGPFLSSSCPFCSPAFPAPFVGLPGRPGLSCGPPFEEPVVAIPDLPFDLADVVGFDPAPLFAQPDMRFIAPSEPTEWLPATGVRLIALGPNDELAFSLVETGSGIVLGGQQGCPNPNGCDTTGPFFDRSLASAYSTASLTAYALSARRELLWALGGDMDSLAGRIQMRGLDDPSPVQVDAPLGHVLAATYRAQDDALYVLDEVREGRGWHARGYVRLVRVVATRTDQPVLEVQARWPRLSWNQRFALVAAPGAGLWVLASADHSRASGAHVAVLLRPKAGDEDGEHEGRRGRHHRRERKRENGWRVAGWHFGRGLIAEVQPRADARGLSYIIERRGEQEAVGLRVQELNGLRDQERDEDRGRHHRRRGRGRHHGRGHEDAEHVLRRCF